MHQAERPSPVCRNLLCILVRVKLSCYEMEKQCSLSVEDYLKAFLETEVKPLWPKGWMQARWVWGVSCSSHRLSRSRLPAVVALSCCWLSDWPVEGKQVVIGQWERGLCLPPSDLGRVAQLPRLCTPSPWV